MKAPLAGDRFAFEALLGRGGTAEVARAHCNRLKRPLAVKYPLAECKDPSQQFDLLAKREHELIGQFRFPGLVPILEEPHRNPSFLLLELCEGPSLDELSFRDRSAHALNLLSALAVDLEFLSASGLVHGDLKPQNIFVPPDWIQTVTSGLFWLKLSDFSLGRMADEPSEAQAGVGTVGFMAAETIESRKSTHRSDLFALGVIAYWLLTDHHPFLSSDCDPARVADLVKSGTFESPMSHCPDLSDDMQLLIEQLLAVEADDRPASAWEVCMRLERMGATYPFRRALRPAHLLKSGKAFEQLVADSLRLHPQERERLESLTDCDPSRLRLLLTANFVRGNLVYSGRFEFNGGIYWPNLFRRMLLSSFAGLSISDKKAAIRQAVSGGNESGASQPSLPMLPALLRPLLRLATVKRLSKRASEAAFDGEQYALATTLFVQSGNLEKACEAAEMAARSFCDANQFDLALAVTRAVDSYADTIGRRFEARHLIMIRGDLQKGMGEIDAAMKSYDDLIALYRDKEPESLLAETYKDLGDLYRMRGEADPGLEALLKALDLYTQLGDDLEISHTRNNLGNIYSLKGDFKSALDSFRQALTIQRRLEVVSDIASTLNNIGIIYFNIGRHQRTMRLFTLALDLQRKADNTEEIARALNNLGHVSYITGHQVTAMDYLEQSLVLNRRLGAKKEVLYNLENLTTASITAGRLRQSLDHLREGLTLAEGIGDLPHQGAFHLSTGIVYRRLGRMAEASEYLDRAGTIAGNLDERQLLLKVALENAWLRFAVGDRSAALTQADRVYNDAEKLNEPHIRLAAAILVLSVEPDEGVTETAEYLIEQLHLVRERPLITYAMAEALLEQGDAAQASETVGRLGFDGDLPQVDIDLAHMKNVKAELAIEQERPDEASEFLLQAEDAARQNGLLPELSVCLTLQGRILMQRGSYEDCFARFKEGLQICKQITNRGVGTADSNHYQGKRMVRYLVEQITHLKSIMQKSKRAEAISHPLS